MTTNKLTDERLSKILSEIQATITEHNSRCVRGSVEVDARLFEVMLLELQLRRKADSAEPVGLFARRNGTWLELCQGDAFEHPDAVKLYAVPQPLTDEEREELQERRKADNAEPIYQLFDSGWYDTNKSTYDTVTGAGMKGRIVYAAPQPAKSLELAGWQFKSVNGDWLGLIDEHGKNQAVREGCEVREVFAIADSVNDREQVRREHAKWSQDTFGDVGPVGPLKHLSKEALEAAAEPGDLSEWADMQFLLWDAQRRAGISDEQINQAMVEKLAVNKQREWPEPKDGEPRPHIK